MAGSGNEPQDDNTSVWETVDSSRFKAMRYDPESAKLSVRWKDGTVGHYLNVPAEEYEQMRAADSLGRHLQTVIIPRFEYQKDESSS